MKRFPYLVLILLLFSSASLCQQPSGTQADATVVIGIVTVLNAASMQATVKTDTGANVDLLFDAKTDFLRMRPEDKNLQHAVRINLADLNLGDRVLTRTKISSDKVAPVAMVIVMTGADVGKKQELDREDWE